MINPSAEEAKKFALAVIAAVSKRYPGDIGRLTMHVGEMFSAWLHEGLASADSTREDYDHLWGDRKVQVKAARDHRGRRKPRSNLGRFPEARYDYLVIVMVDDAFMPRVVYRVDKATAQKYQRRHGTFRLTKMFIWADDVEVIYGVRGWNAFDGPHEPGDGPKFPVSEYTFPQQEEFIKQLNAAVQKERRDSGY